MRPRVRRAGLAKNTLLNLAGEGLPFLFAIVTIPFVIRGLGSARFGVLALVWAVLGYFGAFDLGIGRAATKFVAEAIGKGEAHLVPTIAWTALRVQAVLGAIGALVLAGLARPLVSGFLNVPVAIRAEALQAFYLLAFAVPLVLVSGSLRGLLEAAQRFDLVNAVKAPFSSANSLLPAFGVWLGWGLPGIVALLVAARLTAAMISFGLCLHVFPALRRTGRVDRASLRPLIGYGGWVAVSSIVSPLLAYLDRFLIGGIISMSAVAYYATPYEMVFRLLVIPTSLVTALFPAFSTLGAERADASVTSLAARSIKYILIVLGPITAVTVAFSNDIIRIWLGSALPRESATALAILSLGVLVLGVAQVPYTLVQARGRPDLTAKIHLVELPIHLLVASALIAIFGIPGAATAWTLRAVLDLLLLTWASTRVSSLSCQSFRISKTWHALALTTMFGLIAFSLSKLALPLALRLLTVGVVGIGTALLGWRFVLDDSDRRRIAELGVSS